MRIKLNILFLIFFALFSIKGFATGACSPAIGNGSCANAAILTSGAACITGETCAGSTVTGASCIAGAFVDCAWYKFQATSATMWVNITNVATDGCITASNVFSGNGSSSSCGALSELDCEQGGANDDLWTYTTLTVGDWYYIQVCYPSLSGGCTNGGSGGNFDFEICVGEPDPLCAVCSTPCGTAQGFASAPSIPTVVAGCTTSPFIPELQPGSTNTFCYRLTAGATSIPFNVIITSNCGAGNVTFLNWSLYTYPACGAPVLTGTIANLTFSPVVVGQDYVFCYTFGVPAGCTHSQHCPYFVGATIPLPIELVSFEAKVIDNTFINLDWITSAEINNDFFTIEKSSNAQTFEVVGIIDGAGNSSITQNYSLRDNNPYKGTSYYRLAQTDYDGTSEYSGVVAVEVKSSIEDINVFPNPIQGLGYLSFKATSQGKTTVTIYDVFGRRVSTEDYFTEKGNNKLTLSTEELAQGMYFLTIDNSEDKNTIKFTKE